MPVLDVHILLMHLQRVHICDSSRGMASTSCVGLAYDTHGITSGGLLHYEVQYIETISIKTHSLKDQCACLVALSVPWRRTRSFAGKF